MHRFKLYFLVLGANGLLAGFLYLNHTPVTPATVEPLALVTEKSIRLVDEAEPVVPPSEFKVPIQAEMMSADAQVETVCRVWGPVDSELEFDELITRLKDQGSEPQIFSESLDVPSQFFVYHESDEANVASKKLTESGVDNYVISRDSGAIVSAGVFSSLESAEKQQLRLKELGFPAIIEIMYQRQTVYHLRAQTLPDTPEYSTSNSGCPTFAHAR